VPFDPRDEARRPQHWPSSIGRTLKVKVIDDAWLDHASVQRQQDQLRIETVTGLQRVVYSTFNLKRKMGIVRARKRLCPDHAVTHQLRGRFIGLGCGLIADRVFFQQVHNGEFDCLWNKSWMDVNGPKRLIEPAQILRSPKDAKQTK